MRINSESDVARLREQLADHLSTSKVEIDNLRRALDDMRYKNEESCRQISLKNDEIESMMDQMENLTAIIEKREDTIVDLKQTVVDIEMKNRKMNDVLNKAIHGKT